VPPKPSKNARSRGPLKLSSDLATAYQQLEDVRAELAALRARSKKFKRLAEREQKVEALRERQHKKKRDTRRKILIGALVLQRIEDGNDKMARWLHRELDKFLVRPSERALFPGLDDKKGGGAADAPGDGAASESANDDA
jgi:hypothetical protein